MGEVFEAIAHDPSCTYCTGKTPAVKLDVDAAYCISLIDQPHRTAYVSAHFHAIGLCQQVTFFRPKRPAFNVGEAIWTSHRTVAQHAVSQGQERVLIMEDDVAFRKPMDVLGPRINRRLATMPDDWWGLFLGHIPVQSYFVKWGLLRTRSAALHAYIANRPLLEWLSVNEPRSPDIPMWPVLDKAIDAATSSLDGMYAVFPMMALQTPMGDSRIDRNFKTDGRRRPWRDVDRWRHLVLFRGALVAEAFAILCSPFHRLTMRWFISRVKERSAAARMVRASGLFDDDFYLRTYPDVAQAQRNPFLHYFEYGAAEGRWPNASFDPEYYAAHAPTFQESDNPLIHYVMHGRQLGYPTHAKPVRQADAAFAR